MQIIILGLMFTLATLLVIAPPVNDPNVANLGKTEQTYPNIAIA